MLLSLDHWIFDEIKKRKASHFNGNQTRDPGVWCIVHIGTCLEVVNLFFDGIYLIVLAVHHPGVAGGFLLRNGSTEAALRYQ